MTTVLNLASENKCPDCLHMELAVRPKVKVSASRPCRIALFLTINFNEQWEKLPGGYVKFGLKGGELRLELTKGTIPYGSRNLAGLLELDVQKSRQSQVSEKASSDRNTSMSTKAKLGVETEIKLASGEKGERTSSQSDTFTIQSCQVTTKGTLDNPAWVFEVQTNEPVLKGLLSQAELATMNLTGTEWKVKALFTVPTLKDVKITEADGPWLRNATPPKRTALELGIAKLLLKRKLRPYLSHTELSHA